MDLQDVIFPDHIKNKIFVELGTWCSNLNYENYKQEEFDNGFYDFKESSISKKIDFTSLKNSFIESELEAIDLVLEEVKSIFLDYNINCRLKSIRSLYRELKNEEDVSFLNYIKDEVLELVELSILLKYKLNNCSLDSAIFYCSAIYIDLLKVKDFLHSHYEGKLNLTTNILSKKDQKEKPQSEITLKSLFKDPLQHDILLSKLINDEVINDNETHYSLNPSILVDDSLKGLRAICAFGYLLNDRHYLNNPSQIEITRALSKMFGVKISKATYSAAVKQCFSIRDHKSEDYFSLFLNHI